jgi:hypothetical protein
MPTPALLNQTSIRPNRESARRPELDDLLLAGDVGRHGQGGAAQTLALARGLVEHLGAAGREHDGGAALGEGVGGGAADAARRAGDDDDEGRGVPVIMVAVHRRFLAGPECDGGAFCCAAASTLGKGGGAFGSGGRRCGKFDPGRGCRATPARWEPLSDARSRGGRSRRRSARSGSSLPWRHGLNAASQEASDRRCA